MIESPVIESHGTLHLTDGSLAHAGHYLHEQTYPEHTHCFVEIAMMIGGQGVHRSVDGRQPMSVGDVVLLRPGVWHGYEDCVRLDLYTCSFSVDLLRRELAWTQEDPLLGYLLWTGPYAMRRRGMLTARLDEESLRECITHLDALDRLRFQPIGMYRSDIIGRLLLFLGSMARAVAADRHEHSEPVGPTHPAVVRAMRRMEASPAHRWTLTELADELHLASGYLVRLFKSATGLPPMDYLSRYRIETAATLLLRTDEPIAQIAQSVGLPDQNYFARRFRAYYGLSATIYRARFSH